MGPTDVPLWAGLPLRRSFLCFNDPMEQGRTDPRAILSAIIAVSATAILFLLWLLYVHQASAQFAGRWVFLPALNAFLNGLSAIALCIGLYFIKHNNQRAQRGDGSSNDQEPMKMGSLGG